MAKANLILVQDELFSSFSCPYMFAKQVLEKWLYWDPFVGSHSLVRARCVITLTASPVFGPAPSPPPSLSDMAGSDEAVEETMETMASSKKRSIAEPQEDEDEVDEFMIATSEVSMPRPAPSTAADADHPVAPGMKKSGGTSVSRSGSSSSSSKGGTRKGGGGRSRGSSADGSVLVGTEVLKNFPGHGDFKGKVVEFVPAAVGTAGAVDVWSVVYADGDSEDMELEELSYWVAFKVQRGIEAKATAQQRKKAKTKTKQRPKKSGLTADMV